MITLRSIRGKLLLWTLPVLVASLSFLIVFSAFVIRDTIYTERKMKQKHVVETAYSIINYYYNLVSTGTMSEFEAKEAAKKAVKALRYETVEYFG